MDRNEIEQMEAEREMDLLMAEMLGWTRARTGPYGTQFWNTPNESIKSEGAIPNYSTDIAAAWEVAEKIYICTRWFELTQLPNGLWRANFTGNTIDTAQAPTAPLAICRAALLARAGG